MHDSVNPFDPIDVVIVLLCSMTDRMLCYPSVPHGYVPDSTDAFGHDD